MVTRGLVTYSGFSRRVRSSVPYGGTPDQRQTSTGAPPCGRSSVRISNARYRVLSGRESAGAIRRVRDELMTPAVRTSLRLCVPMWWAGRRAPGRLSHPVCPLLHTRACLVSSQHAPPCSGSAAWREPFHYEILGVSARCLASTSRRLAGRPSGSIIWSSFTRFANFSGRPPRRTVRACLDAFLRA